VLLERVETLWERVTPLLYFNSELRKRAGPFWSFPGFHFRTRNKKSLNAGINIFTRSASMTELNREIRNGRKTGELDWDRRPVGPVIRSAAHERLPE
ncbi:hypothetical protein CSUI_005663, partial [Cystoisospora suis]